METELIDGKDYLVSIGDYGTIIASYSDGVFCDWDTDGYDHNPADCKAIPLDLAIQAPELQAENERLSAGLHDAGCEMSTQAIYVDDLEAENERLRAALKEIVNCPSCGVCATRAEKALSGDK